MRSRLITLLFALTAAGCSIPTSTTPITEQSGTPVPAARIYQTELTVPAPGRTAKISFLRDAGALGSACTHKILVDGKPAFAIRAGEYQTLYFPPGQYVFSLEIEGGICPKHSSSHSAVLKDGADETHRIYIPSLTSRPQVAVIGGSPPSTGGFPPSTVPPFDWDSAYATPGVSLTLREVGRLPSSKGTVIEYELTATGFSGTESSVLWWKRGLSFDRLSATIGDDGTVKVFGSKSLMVEGYVPGQALDLALTAGNNRAHAKISPFPVEARNGDYGASVELLSDTGLVFHIAFTGFKPGEKVEITSQYKAARAVQAVEASPKGDIIFPVQFGPRDRGTAMATATGSGGTVSIQYKIGSDALVRHATAPSTAPAKTVASPSIAPVKTVAPPVLQRDILDFILALDGDKDCKQRTLVNTEVITPPTSANSFTAVERWTVDRCGKRGPYRVIMTPSSRGGTDFKVGPER